MPPELQALQEALDTLNNAVAGLPVSLRKTEVTRPYPAPPPVRGVARGDATSKAIELQLQKLTRSTEALNKALGTMVTKADAEAKMRGVQKARLEAIRTQRDHALAKIKADAAIQKQIDASVAAALKKAAKSPYPKPDEEEVEKAYKADDEECDEETQKALEKEFESVIEKMTEEEKKAFVARMAAARATKKAKDPDEEEEEAGEHVAKAKRSAYPAPDDEEEVGKAKKDDEEIPEELVKLLEAEGIGTATKAEGPSNAQTAQILKKLGFRPVPVSKTIPTDSRSTPRTPGDATLGDLAVRLKGMSYARINQLRTKTGAW